MLVLVGCGKVENGTVSKKGQSSGKNGNVTHNLTMDKGDSDGDLKEYIVRSQDLLESGGSPGLPFITEDLIIRDEQGSIPMLYTRGFEEELWPRDLGMFIPTHYKVNISKDNYLYYWTENDGMNKIQVSLDKSKNTPIKVDELEYEIYSTDTFFEDTSYVKRENTLTAYDLATHDVKWEVEYKDTHFNGFDVYEAGQYTAVNTGEFEFFVMDKESGEVLFENDERAFYDDTIEHDGNLYLISTNGLTGSFLIVDKLDTSTWEKENILTFNTESKNDFTSDVHKFEIVGNKLVHMYEFGVIIADLDSGEVIKDFILAGEESIHTGRMPALIKDGKIYALTDNRTSLDFYQIEVDTGEILKRYILWEEDDPEEYRLSLYRDEMSPLRMIGEDDLYIITRDQGILEFKLSDFK